MQYTRRQIGKLALSAIPATSLLPRNVWAAEKPNSKVNGVVIGMNVPYNFGNQAMSAEEILQRCVQLGVSGVELRARPVEAFMGLPQNLRPQPGGGNRGGAPATPPPPPTPVQQAAAKARLEDIRKWRMAAPISKARDVRKMYEDAGVMVEIVKFDDVPTYSDDELEYTFNLAKALGARAISCEFSMDDAKRIAPFAQKHRMLVGFHGHAAVTPAIFDELLAVGPYIGANVDIGHFVAGNSISPVPVITKHHDRITHVHVKDRKMHDGPNMPFGQGETPIIEVLRLLRDKRWNIQATIEFEYRVPEGSDRMIEIAKTVKYCREALA
jgi:sugar phosphate isomerase/epimerase